MSPRILSLTLQANSASRRAEVAIEQAVVAGWTGRDAAAVEKHIKELEALGVKRPATTPIFYRVSAARLTTDDSIEAVGRQHRAARRIRAAAARRPALGRRRLRPHRSRGGEIRRDGLQADVRQADRAHVLGVRRGRAALGPPDAARARDRRRQARALPGGRGDRDDRAARAHRPPRHRRQAAGRHADVLRHARRPRRRSGHAAISHSSWKTRCSAARSPTPIACSSLPILG